jgi:Tfp pilus assembly protein PilZ
MTGGDESRGERRVNIKWPVTMLTPQSQIEGEMKNISPTGGFISSRAVPPLESNFFIIIRPPDRQTMSVVGKVIWSKPLQTSEGDSSHGVGVRFKNITAGDHQFLNNLVAKHYRKKVNRKVDRRKK